QEALADEGDGPEVSQVVDPRDVRLADEGEALVVEDVAAVAVVAHVGRVGGPRRVRDVHDHHAGPALLAREQRPVPHQVGVVGLPGVARGVHLQEAPARDGLRRRGV
ncbi:MAG: hypothetical protein ACK559_24310, partial [bacterium]